MYRSFCVPVPIGVVRPRVKARSDKRIKLIKGRGGNNRLLLSISGKNYAAINLTLLAPAVQCNNKLRARSYTATAVPIGVVVFILLFMMSVLS